MASQTGQQIISLNISRSKSNQAMKLGQLKRYSKKYFCLNIMEKMR